MATDRTITMPMTPDTVAAGMCDDPECKRLHIGFHCEKRKQLVEIVVDPECAQALADIFAAEYAVIGKPPVRQ